MDGGKCREKNKAESESRSVMSDSLRPHGLYPARLLCPWDSPSKNTGVGHHNLLQGIFLTQGQNPGLPHCRRILYHLSHQRNQRVLEGVAYPFSSRSSQPRNRGSPALQVDFLPAELPGRQQGMAGARGLLFSRNRKAWLRY